MIVAARCRKVEDKFAEHGVELKSFCLNLDTSKIHGNRDTPAVFNCWLGILDHTLPTKGTLHRASRSTTAVDKEATNMFFGIHMDCLKLASHSF